MKRIVFKNSTICAIVALMAIVGLAANSCANVAPGSNSTYAVSSSVGKHFQLGIARDLANQTSIQAEPEVFFDSDGNMVVFYYRGNNAFFVRYNGTSTTVLTSETHLGQEMSGAFVEDNTSARGQRSALTSNDTIVHVYSRVPDEAVRFKAVRFDGTVVTNESLVSTSDLTPTYWPAVAVGENDSLHFVWIQSNGTGAPYRAVTYSVLSSNGTLLGGEVQLFSDGNTNRNPQICADRDRSRDIVSWYSDERGAWIASVAVNGSLLWGPVNLGQVGSPVSFAVLKMGAILVTWADQDRLMGSLLESNGTIALANVSLAVGSTGAETPRPFVGPSEDVLVVWSDFSNGVDFDVRVAGFNGTNLALTVPVMSVTVGKTSEEHPFPSVSPSGEIWVAWTSKDPPSSKGRGTTILLRWSGAQLIAPYQNATTYRGEDLVIPISLRNLVGDQMTYEVGVAIVIIRGPLGGWSAVVADGARGTNLTSGMLEPNADQNLSLVVRAPVFDPPGYSAYISINVVDTNWRPMNISLRFNVTVIAGHSFEISPPSENMTILPGDQGDLTFSVLNAGNLTEANISINLSPQAPPGWNASLSPGSYSGAPGISLVIHVRVTVDSIARWPDSYCGRVSLVNPNDTYSVAYADFCSLAALVSRPSLDPPFQVLTIWPGGTNQSNWSLANVGNARDRIDCSLTLIEALPDGWWAFGSPVGERLAGNESAFVGLSFVSPTEALGGSSINFSVEAACIGANVTARASVEIRVAEVHRITWRLAGYSVEALPNGTAMISAQAENQGNVPEQVSVTLVEFPQAWDSAFALEVEGLYRRDLPPFSLGQVGLFFSYAVNRTTAGEYPIRVTFAAGETTPFQANLTVRVPRHYGLSVALSNESVEVAPGDQFTIETSLNHEGNTPESFLVQLVLASPQIWTWSASYDPEDANDRSWYSESTLLIDPFSRGILSLNLSVPRTAPPGGVLLTFTLTSSNGESVSFSRSARIVMPDLEISYIDAKSLIYRNPGIVNSTVRIRNSGNGASGPFLVKILVDDVVVDLRNVGSLEPGWEFSADVFFEVTYGTHQLVVIADPRDGPGISALYGAVREVSEDNNEMRVYFALNESPGPPPHVDPPQIEPEPVPFVPGFGLSVLIAVVAGATGAAVLLLVFGRSKRNGRIQK